MKNKKIAVTLLALICAFFVAHDYGAAYANSAQHHWYGTTASGMQVVDGECPLEIKHEKLTFNIDGFPSNYYQTAEEAAAYGANVTAEYTIFNPADFAVTVSLAFPFGTRPSYFDYELGAVDTGKYDVTLDGAAVEKTLRHTYTPYSFNADADVPKLRDGYATDRFFGTDLNVEEYVFEFKDIPENRDFAPYASFPVVCPENTRVNLSECNGGRSEGDTRYVGLWVKNGKRVSVYAVGEKLDVLPEWTVYKNGSEETVIDGRAELVEQKRYSFLEFATRKFDEKQGISKTDWYNAAVDAINGSLNSYDDKRYFDFNDNFTERNALMRWYCYELTVPAGAEVVNAVTAPLYPYIDGDYSPPVYGYTYLSSPAKSWRKFGSLEIIIKTPFYMLDSGDLPFYTTDDGYTLSRSGLPDGEISFTLCSVENPKRDVKYGWITVFIVIIVIGGALCIGAVVWAVVILVRLRKKSKTDDNGQNKEE